MDLPRSAGRAGRRLTAVAATLVAFAALIGGCDNDDEPPPPPPPTVSATVPPAATISDLILNLETLASASEAYREGDTPTIPTDSCEVVIGGASAILAKVNGAPVEAPSGPAECLLDDLIEEAISETLDDTATPDDRRALESLQGRYDRLPPTNLRNRLLQGISRLLQLR